MEIEFDHAKDAQNIRRHGISLTASNDLSWDEALAWPDERFAYDEFRMSALAPLGDRLYFVAFVDRGEVRRVIMMRDANRREVQDYGRNRYN
ncbi:MAG: BrnT family toxin [Candidatus Accumulibacter sp.]|jgi:uncharacterized DUF497 family protein|nr:BrnT family toxin [Accumulibacter sp.]